MKPEIIYKKLMNLAYKLEDCLDYDETEKGMEFGEIVNKLQKFNLKK